MIRQLAQVILKRDDKILLGLKKAGFGINKLVKPGGKLEPGESPRQAAIRETFEEVGLRVNSCKKVAQIVFPNLVYKGAAETCVMHVYLSEDFDGEPTETDELAPAWYSLKDLPYDRMWADSQYWLPGCLRGEMIDGQFRYDEKHRLLDYELNSLPNDQIANFDDALFRLKMDGDPESFDYRYAARAVLIDKNYRVALICAKNRGRYYKLPGGGVDDGETINAALHRELIEEAGWECEVLAGLGFTREERHKFEQINISYAFLARATNFVGTQLMEDEIEDGFELQWFENIDEAIAAVEKVDTANMVYQAKFFTARELAILRAARKVLKEQYGQ